LVQGAAKQQHPGIAHLKQQRQQLSDNRGGERQDILALQLLWLLLLSRVQLLGRHLSCLSKQLLQSGLELYRCRMLPLLLVLKAAVVFLNVLQLLVKPLLHR
jgi:hypothetical protein